MATPNSVSEDGEIIETGVDDSNTASSRNVGQRTSVDRRDRDYDRYSRSPDRAPSYRPNRRSPSPRGFKRARDDRDSYQGGRGGRSRPHYDDAYSNSRRHFHDEDRPHRGGSSRYDDLDRPASRHRSEPYHEDHESRPNKRRDRGQDRVTRERDSFGRNAHGDQAKSIKYAQNERHSRDDYASKRTAAADSASSQAVAKPAQGVPAAERNQKNAVGQKSDDQELADKLDQEATLEPEEPVDEDAEIERRRKRREEILRKSRASTPALQALQAEAALASPGSGQVSTPQRTEVNTPRSDVASPAEPLSAGREAMSPAEFDLSNDLNLINSHGEAQAGEEDGPSAADYDPTADMREDERRDELRHGNVGLHGEERQVEQAALATIEEDPVQKPTAADDDDFDMFADDIDDSKIAPAKPAAAKVENVQADQENAQLAQPNGGGILEGDDKDGYYKIRPGEILSGQYQVQSALGKGMFSGVARAEDIKSKRLVAIKIMRNNDALRKGGFTEIAILQKLNAADPDDKKHIVRFERAFEYKGHLCMAFENLSMNLREVLKKFGNNVGINLNATRAYAYQIFLALGHMRKCNIIHADLKPDNILVNENRNVLKICDLGTAVDRSDAATAHNEITPYLVSRFYRAPEIILGMPYDYAIDMWSIGCTLYEMYTGKILFTGDSNNQMLKTIMEIRGKFSAKLYRRGGLAHMHFDELGNFISVERDKALGKTTVRTLSAVKPTRDLRTRLLAASGGMTDAEKRELHHFVELLERCLTLNPDRRITPAEALKHPFFTHKVHAGAFSR